MAEKVKLTLMKCPSCGANLKVKNEKETIACVYCGSSVIPVADSGASASKEAGFNGTLKVDGIKTSSSALAYIEQFFEEYDWEAFSYAQTLSVAEIERLAASLKVTSADDKNTWIACFKTVSVPYLRKVSGCRQILSSVIEQYKNNDLDAYSRFDAYKRISTMLAVSRPDVIDTLEKYAAKAAKYGASAAETEGLRAEIGHIKNAPSEELYGEIEQIPEIQTFIREKDAKIVQTLAEKGIQAEAEYRRATQLIENRRYVEALDVLLTLKGYSDTDALIQKLDRYYLISDVLEIEGTLYCFSKSSSEQGGLDLFPTENGEIAGKPLVRGIGQIISNYANVLYYLDESDRLKKFDLSSNKAEKLSDQTFSKKDIHICGRKAFLLSGREEYEISRDLFELNLATGAVKVFLKNVKTVLSLNGNKMVYQVSSTVEQDGERQTKTFTNVINVNTMDVIALGTKNLTIEGFIQNSVVYTQDSPNSYNKNLYIKALNSNEPEKLIEQNIYKFCGIIAGKLFYYVGNSVNQSLIHVKCDGTGRKEWPLYITKVLFEQGGWLYFIRKSGYNSILCKARPDGSESHVIAADIEEFIEIKNGYLYYINDVSALVKIRMDGSNQQLLCGNVETVLAVKEDKIVFVSFDDRIKTGTLEQTTYRTVRSIYAVDFSGSGKIKLAYNVKNAQKYDENTVYYIAAQEIRSSYDRLDKQVDVLYKLDVPTNRVERLLDLQIQPADSDVNGFIVAMVIMAFCFLLAFIGFGTNSITLGVIGLVIGFLALIAGIIAKANSNQ